MALRGWVLAVFLLVAACAPVVQRPGIPGADFQGPRLETDALVSFDGERLPLTIWTPESGEPWAVIVGLHGWNSHAGAFYRAAPYWATQGVATYAFDQRGYGRSPGRGLFGGEESMMEDVRVAVALVRQRYPHAVIAVAGISMGGSVAIRAFASDRPPAADRLLLFAPGIWGWSTQPSANKIALWSLAHTLRGEKVRPPGWLVRGVQATDNEEELAAAQNDPLVIWSMRPDAVYGVVNMMEGASRDIGRLTAPTAYFYGAHDRLMPQEATRRAVARLRPGTRTAYYANGYHQLLLDRQAKLVWDDALSFIRDPAVPLPSGAPPIPGAPAARPRRRRRVVRTRRPCETPSLSRRAAGVRGLR